MGRIYNPPLAELALALARQSALTTFVETGTYQGAATRWAAAHFEQVWTVEISPEYQAQAKAALAGATNVNFVLGDSASALREVCAQLQAPALFWLDAHAGGGNFGSHDHCPLLDELDIIDAGPHQHCIMIDDARAFTAPPPPPFDLRCWPSLDQIFRRLLARRDYYVVLSHDCLVCVPPAARPAVEAWVLRVRTKI